ncbi:bile acid:sodium symporter family protein [Massilia sp. GER05]|uniref:bile acid:sodium symporter family protein n=1 Tax=unclassified Massilia TaxID=2609279 RepID=UPI0039B10194
MNAIEKASAFVGKTFSLWVLLFAALGFFAPQLFVGYKGWIAPLLGIVMFGMGLTLSTEDFRDVFRRPKDVAIGVVGHYLIMPGIAYVLAIALRLPPEIAVGVILVGCCPSGTASNVMTFLARGDVALGVSIGAVSTLIAPFATPALVSLLAGAWMHINAASLFMDIVQVVIVPIALGIVARTLFRRQAAASVKALPLVSTVAIVLIIAIIVALNQSKLLTNGLLMFAAVILHNLLGFALGYLFARLFGMDLAKRKAVMFETGMQNSGLGAALAAAHFSPLAAVPSALFSVWHNLSGSALATWFARRKE